MLELTVPCVLLLVSLAALRGKHDVYGALLDGGRDGLRLLLTVTPALVMLLTAVGMLRASGVPDALVRLLTPAARLLGLPPQTLPLVLLRPCSGSAALAVGAELMAFYGPDSLVGRTAAVMLGSTETTFYVLSVYFSSCGIRKGRYVLPAALIADLAGFLGAALTVRLLWHG